MEISDFEQILNVLAIYCHALDDGNYERLAEIFDVDTVYELTGGPFLGVDESVAALRKMLGDEPTKRHLNLNHQISISGNTAAVRSDWYSLNRGDSGFSFAAGGVWSDTLVKRNGRWVITHRAIGRL